MQACTPNKVLIPLTFSLDMCLPTIIVATRGSGAPGLCCCSGDGRAARPCHRRDPPASGALQRHVASIISLFYSKYRD